MPSRDTFSQIAGSEFSVPAEQPFHEPCTERRVTLRLFSCDLSTTRAYPVDVTELMGELVRLLTEGEPRGRMNRTTTKL
jgi:hypothetical protein